MQGLAMQDGEKELVKDKEWFNRNLYQNLYSEMSRPKKINSRLNLLNLLSLQMKKMKTWLKMVF